MAYQSIGIGSSANDGTGDTLRVGADKVNDNFVELYTKLGNGSALSNLTFPTGTDTIVGRATTDTLTNKTLTNPTVNAATLTGALDLTGAVLAGTNALVFEGSGADANETTFAITNPTADRTITFPDAAGTVALTSDITVTATSTTTFTNKTLTAPILGGTTTTASGNLIVDPATQILEVRGDGSSVEGMIQLNCHVNSHGQKIQAADHSVNATNTLVLPGGSTIGNSDATLVSDTGTQTLTNKTLTNPTINAATFSGVLAGAIIGGVNAVNSAGAISLTHLVTEITTGGSALAISLANGTAGQIKIISMVVDGGGTATLTPTTFANGSTIAFADVNDTVMLLYANTIGWVVIANSGATVS